MRPVAPAAAVPAVPADGVRREPKGGKLPYSEQAWAQAQKPDTPVAVAKVEPKPEPRPEAKPEPRPEAKPEAKPDEARGRRNPRQWRQDRLGLAHVGQGHRGLQRNLQQGVDLAGKPGDPVLVPPGPRRLRRHGLRGYGKLVIVKHDNSFQRLRPQPEPAGQGRARR